MTTPSPLHLPHPTRAALLTGPTISLTLPLSSTPSAPHTIPSLPRRLLFAFSRLAATQLATSTSASHATTTITLPRDACTIAALEYLVFWMKQTCVQRAPRPIGALEDARMMRNLWVAARVLGVGEVERELRPWA